MQRIALVSIITALVLAAPAISDAQAPSHSGEKSSVERNKAGQAKDGQHGRKGMRQRAAKSFMKGIELSDAQKTQMKTINERFRADAKALRESSKPAAGAERQRPDAATREQFTALQTRQRAEIRAVLTPAQQQTFDQNVAQARERLQKRGEKRGEKRGVGQAG